MPRKLRVPPPKFLIPVDAQSWQAAVEHVTDGVPEASTDRQAELASLVGRYLVPASRLEGERLLGRIVRKHVGDGERLVWCGEVAGRPAGVPRPKKQRPFWMLFTSQTCFVAPRRSGEPMSHPVQSVFWSDPFIFEPVRSDPYLQHLVAVINGYSPVTVGRLGDKQLSRPALLAYAALGVAQAMSRVKPMPPRSVTKSAAGRPAPRLIRTAREAELVAAEWMRYWGYSDAEATPVGADSGVDVVAAGAVAQVKMEGVPTGRPTVQALLGAAVGEGKDGLFFSLAGYTAEAVVWADRVGLALYAFDLQGEPVAANAVARRAVDPLGSSDGTSP